MRKPENGHTNLLVSVGGGAGGCCASWLQVTDLEEGALFKAPTTVWMSSFSIRVRE